MDQEKAFEVIRELWLAWLDAGGPYFQNASAVRMQLDFKPGFVGGTTGKVVTDADGNELFHPPKTLAMGIDTEFGRETTRVWKHTTELLWGLRRVAADPERRPNHFRMRVVRDGQSEIAFFHEPGLAQRRSADMKRMTEAYGDSPPPSPLTAEQELSSKRLREQTRLARDNFFQLYHRPPEERLTWIERFLWSHAGIGNERLWEEIRFRLGTDRRGIPVATQHVRWEGSTGHESLPVREPDLLVDVLRILKEEAGRGEEGAPAMSVVLTRDGLKEPALEP